MTSFAPAFVGTDKLPFKIISFWVDINKGTISLSLESVDNIILNIDAFLSISSRHHLLREWQHLGGHLNWLLNVLPWGQPALSELYQKTQGKNKPSTKIFPNATVQSDLWRLADTILFQKQLVSAF